MTIELIVIGKTDSKEIAALVELYARRVNHYCRFAVTALPDVRNTKSMTVRQQRTAEGEAILRQLTDGDYVTLLDERGEEYRSVEFALWLQKRLNSGVKRLVLVVKDMDKMYQQKEDEWRAKKRAAKNKKEDRKSVV